MKYPNVGLFETCANQSVTLTDSEFARDFYTPRSVRGISDLNPRLALIPMHRLLTEVKSPLAILHNFAERSAGICGVASGSVDPNAPVRHHLHP